MRSSQAQIRDRVRRTESYRQTGAVPRSTVLDSVARSVPDWYVGWYRATRLESNACEKCVSVLYLVSTNDARYILSNGYLALQISVNGMLCETPLCDCSSSSCSNAGPGETRNPLPLRNGSTKAPPRGTEVVCRPLPQPFPQCLGDSGSQPSIGAAGVSLARAALCITSVGTAIDTAIAPSAVRVYVWKPG